MSPHLLNLITSDTIIFFLFGAVSAAVFYILILVKNPHNLLLIFSHRNEPVLFERHALRDTDGTYHDSYSAFRKKIKLGKATFAISFLALIVKIVSVLGVSFFLISVSEFSNANEPDSSKKIVSAGDTFSSSTPVISLTKKEADLILSKPEGYITPTSAEDTPVTKDHKQLKTTLESAFRLSEVRKDEFQSFTMTQMLSGKLIFTPDDQIILYGTSLPGANVSLLATTDQYQNQFLAIADARGAWQVELPPCDQGVPVITAQSSVGTVHTGENYFGSFECKTDAEALEKQIISLRQDQTLTETTQQITAPTLATIAVINTGAAIPFVGFLPALMYFFSEPLALLFKKRRRGFGVIFDSVTKRPLDLVVVRLYDRQSKKLLQTQVTDQHGRYTFIVNPGSYVIRCEKKDFTFPTRLLNRDKEDGVYNNIYHGEPVTVTHSGKTLLNYNIPLDNAQKPKPYRALLFQHGFKNIQRSVALLGPLLGMLIFLFQPTTFFFAMMLLHFALYLIFIRMTRKPKAKGWGYVVDSLVHAPVKNAVVKLFDTEHHKLLDTHITNNKGQYNFLVGPNKYYLTVEKEGYELYRSGILNVPHGEEGVISKDITLHAMI